jgi:hypothetical protein
VEIVVERAAHTQTDDVRRDRGPVERLVRRPGLDWAVPLVLFWVALAVGWLFLPSHSPVITHEFNLKVQTAGPLTEVSMVMAPSSPHRYDLQVGLDGASDAVGLWFNFQPGVTTDCPASSAVLSCTPASPSDGNLLYLRLRPLSTVDVAVGAPIFTFSANGESAEGWLPFVNCDSCGGPGSAATVFRVTYKIPDVTSYDWTSGPPPGLTDGEAVWQQVAGQLQEPVLVEGTDPRTQQRDEVHIFLSGISIGIAGALFAGSLQAFLVWNRRRAPRR